MPRIPRLLIDGAIYHVFNRGNNKMTLFHEPSDYRHFLYRILEAKQIYAFEVFHYCLMRNHFHLLLRVSKGTDLPIFMHKILLKYAIYYKMKYDFVGHVFQERFRSPRIPEDSYYLQCGRYIERNPLQAGLVTRAEDYPFSSAGYYALGQRDDLITPNLFYAEMGKDAPERRKNYQTFLSFKEPYTDLIEKFIVQS